MSSNSIVAVDLGSYTIKVAEFLPGKGNSLILQNFFFSDLDIDPSKEVNPLPQIQESLARIFKDNHIRNKRVAYTVSGQSVFPKFIKLPPIDRPEKVKQIIKYEAQQNVPFPIDQVVWDYEIFSPPGSFEYEVALFAVKSEVIEENYAMMTQIGIVPVLTDVAPMAIYNAFRHSYGSLEGCTLMVDIGAKTTNLIFIEPERFFCRSIPVGGNNLTQSIASEFQVPFAEAEKLKRSKGFVGLGGAYEDPKDPDVARISKLIRQGMTRLHAEITRSANFYRTQQGGKSPDRLLLCGGSSVMTYTPQFFKEKLNVEVDYFDPLANIEVSPKIDKETIQASINSLGEVVGLALRQNGAGAIEINLEPPSLVSRRLARLRLPIYIGTAVAILAGIYMWWIAIYFRQQKIEMQSAEVNNVVDQYESNKARIQKEQQKQAEMEVDLKKVINIIAQKDYTVKMIRDLNERIHENIWITSFEPTAATIPLPGPKSAQGQGTSASGSQQTPAAPAPRRGRGRQAVAAIVEAPALAATVYAIDGLCKVETDDESARQVSDIVYKFVERLSESDYFVIPDVNNAIIKLETPKQGDFVYSFQIKVGVKPVEAFLDDEIK